MIIVTATVLNIVKILVVIFSKATSTKIFNKDIVVSLFKVELLLREM